MVVTTSYSSKNINESKPNSNLDQKYASPSHGNARHVEHGFVKNNLGIGGETYRRSITRKNLN